MPFALPVRARYYEVDQQGVVFNMWYLGWFDEAMTAYLESIGFGPEALIERGLDVQLVHSEIDWRGSVRFAEQVDVVVTTERVGGTSFTLGYDIRRDDAPIVHGSIVYVVVAGDGSGKRPVPDDLRVALTR